MDLLIRNTGQTPIYLQIVEQLKEKILSGQLQPGDALPSMRLLAKELRISVITTKRAYEELELQGFISTVPGKGSFVSDPDLELVREAHLRQIEADLRAALQTARSCGVTGQELHEMLSLLQQEE